MLRRTVLAMPWIVGAASGARAEATDWARVEKAAIEGGKLTLYQNIPPPLGDAWIDLFRKAYPKIQVEATRLASAEAAQRFPTEYAAGVSRVDAVITLWDEALPRWSRDGWIRRWTPPEAAALDPVYRRDDQFFVLHLIRSCLVSHRTKIRDADAPAEWSDFLDPKWKGKIGINPPWRSVAAQEMIAYWESQGARDVAARLKANDVRFFNGSAGVVQAVVRGDVLVAATIEPPAISALDDGAPIRVRYPKSGVPATTAVGFVPAKSPNPDAGMLFLNWAMSQAGQQSLQDIAGAPAVRPGLKPPKLVPGLDGMRIVLTESVLTHERQKSMIDEWRTVFGVK